MSFVITKKNSISYVYLKHLYRVYKPKNFNIDTDNLSKFPLNPKALSQAFRLCGTMLAYYQRVFFLRVDLHPKVYSCDNKVMSLFIKKTINKLEIQYQCKVGYFCAREQVKPFDGTKKNKQHYHLALMLSAHKVKAAHNILNQIKEDWELHCQGGVHFVDNPYAIMYRGDKRSIDTVIYRLSYFTKNITKEFNENVNSYLCNEIKLRAKKGITSISGFLFVNPSITHANNSLSRHT